MSDINPPGQPADSGDTAWQEYLTGSGSGASGAGAHAAGHEAVAAPGVDAGESSTTGKGTAVPHRVIGTPSPATTRTMLASEGRGGAEPPARELPSEPENPVRAKKAELVVAACFVLAMLAGFGFLVAYSLIGLGSLSEVLHSNLALGTTMGLTFLLLGIGAVVWVRHLMPDVELTEQRHLMRSDPRDRAAFKQTFEEGAQASGFVKRPLVRRTLIAATIPLGLAPLFLLRDLGPLPGKSLDHTAWRKGLRLLVYGTNRPITPAEFSSPGSIISVVPDGFQDNDEALAKAAVIIIKFRPGELKSPTNLNWTVNDIVAYSKICTHVGCPAALYEQTTHHILCPCHQSTFDAARGAEVIFGPATRPLPQLPIGVDAQGFLIALGDFNQPVGPSYWERS
jgi:ubiquinol-cytochrome c reductase iron-sulfur subunit